MIRRHPTIQTEVQADVDGREFIPKLVLGLRQRQRRSEKPSSYELEKETAEKHAEEKRLQTVAEVKTLIGSQLGVSTFRGQRSKDRFPMFI